jgi:hypothetical protein
MRAEAVPPPAQPSWEGDGTAAYKGSRGLARPHGARNKEKAVLAQVARSGAMSVLRGTPIRATFRSLAIVSSL